MSAEHRPDHDSTADAKDGSLPAVPRWRAEIPFALAVLAGALLRLWQLDGQIVGDDEWHALHMLLRGGYGYIAGHFGAADYCIPLTLFYKLLADTVGLTEGLMRLPVLVCGVAALWVFPRLVRDDLGREAALVMAWYLAVSPLHTYFSRYARPYAISLLLTVLAVAALAGFVERKPHGRAAVLFAAAVAAPYFHLTALPALLAVVALAIGEHLCRFGSDGLRGLLRLAAAVAVGWILLLGPPMIGDLASLRGKARESGLTWFGFSHGAKLWLGTAHTGLVAALLAFAAAGAVTVVRRGGRTLGYLAVAACAQLAAVVVLRPRAAEHPIVVARYALLLIPLLTALVAAGMVGAGRFVRCGEGRLGAGPLSVALCLSLLWFGPHREWMYRPNQWTNHAKFQYCYDFDSRPCAAVLVSKPVGTPSFYDRLAALPRGALTIVEAPGYVPWANNPYPWYQQVHRQRMLIGFVGSQSGGWRPGELEPARPGFRFRNAVHLADRAGLRERGVRYVILHRRLHEEMPKGPRREAVNLEAWVGRYRDEYGPPVYEDEWLTVFDVTRGPAPKGTAGAASLDLKGASGYNANG